MSSDTSGIQELKFTQDTKGIFFKNYLDYEMDIDDSFPKGHVSINVTAIQGERNGNFEITDLKTCK